MSSTSTLKVSTTIPGVDANSGAWTSWSKTDQKSRFFGLARLERISPVAGSSLRTREAAMTGWMILRLKPDLARNSAFSLKPPKPEL